MDQDELAQYRGMVWRFLLFLVREPEAAEDITQETFCVAVSKGPDPQKGTNYGAWLRSIARNLARNHFRKHRGSHLLLHADVLALAESQFVAAGSDQDDAWEARRRALRPCVQRLSDAQRDLLRRRYERRQRVQHLAKELGVAPNSVSKRLERIRDALRKCIDAALKGERGE